MNVAPVTVRMPIPSIPPPFCDAVSFRKLPPVTVILPMLAMPPPKVAASARNVLLEIVAWPVT